jgi:hypothetical protein
MFGGRARAERRARAEADKLGRQADEYAQQAGQQPSTDRGPEPSGDTYAVEKDGMTLNWSELGVEAMEAGGYDTSQILGGYGQQVGASATDDLAAAERACEGWDEPLPTEPSARDAGPYVTYGRQMDTGQMLAGNREADAEDAAGMGHPELEGG